MERHLTLSYFYTITFLLTNLVTESVCRGRAAFASLQEIKPLTLRSAAHDAPVTLRSAVHDAPVTVRLIQ